MIIAKQYPKFRHILAMLAILAVLLPAAGCGTAKASPHVADRQESTGNNRFPLEKTPSLTALTSVPTHEKVLLATYNRLNDGTLYEQTFYTYNDRGLLVHSETQDQYNDIVFSYEYDELGRLVKKNREPAGDSHYPREVEREYDGAGRLVSESRNRLGDYWSTAHYTYEADNRVLTEHWESEDLEDYDYTHSYRLESDGTLIDLRRGSSGVGELIYDSKGRLIQGYDDYWLTPIEYSYFEDKYFAIRTESMQMDGDDYVWTYAYILDAAGAEIEQISLSGMFMPESAPTLTYDLDGYLHYVNYEDGQIEFVFGALSDSQLLSGIRR